MTDSNLKRAQTMTLIAAFLGWMFDGLEMGIFPLVARPALQEFQAAAGIVDETFVQLWMGRITATFLLGAAAGGLVFGWLGDRIGRVRAMTLSVLAYSLFTGLNSLFRFLAALGMGGEWSLGVALVMEAWPNDKRPLMAGVIGAAANVGYLLIAGIAVMIPITRDSWRWVMLVGAAPALLTLLITYFVPESEHWKQAVAREGKSKPLHEIVSGHLLKNTVLAILFASVALIVTWGIVQWIPLWADQMTGGKQPHVKGLIQVFSSIGAITGCLIAPLVGAKFGRRPVYFGLCLGSLIVCSILFRGFHEYNVAFLMMTGVVGMFTAAFYGWLPQYLPELFPTRVRATGQGVAFNTGRILAALGAYNMGAIMGYFDKSYAKAGSAIVFVYLVGMVLIWFAPETKGRPLPE
ncbi:MAG: MFS transporter [Verrucomicrobia bacterium]|nr:MFS transporter [Verrucomicrobiota bacterium]